MGWIACNFKIKMKLFFLCTLAIAVTSQPTERQCNAVYFGGKYHEVEVLKDGLNNIHELVLNRNDNTLYFILDQIAKIPTTVLGYLNIDTREAGVIDGIRNASSIAVDQESNKVYVGGQDGIFKINHFAHQNLRVPEKLPVYDNIKGLFYKDVLFYTNSRKQAYMYDNGHINPVFELQYVHPEKIILDDDYNIFFTEGKDLFRVRLGTRVVNSHERYRTNVLAVDSEYKPYISTSDGIYTYNKYKYVFDKVSDMTGLKGLAFNKKGEAIYAIVDFLIKINFNSVPCKN